MKHEITLKVMMEDKKVTLNLQGGYTAVTLANELQRGIDFLRNKSGKIISITVKEVEDEETKRSGS